MVDTDPRDRPDEIEVTEEMIEAGVDALTNGLGAPSWPCDSYRDVAVAVFCAMLRAIAVERVARER